MRFVNHPSNNALFTAPKDMENCDDLPVTVVPNEDGSQCLLSFWKPSPSELELLNSNGYLVLLVYGRNHPPVAVEVTV